MAVFGFEGIGGSHDYDSTSYSHCCKFTSGSDAAGATVTNISCYMRGESGTINVKAAIWPTTAGGAKIAESGVVSVTTTAGWKDFALSGVIAASTAYWLGVIASGNHRYYYDAGDANQRLAQYTVSYPTVPDPWDTLNEAYAAYKMSVHADYTPVAAGQPYVSRVQQVAGMKSWNRSLIAKKFQDRVPVPVIRRF